jgi:hypothetical protein
VERQLVSRRAAMALSLASLAAGLLAVGFSAASFTDTSQNPQTVSADPDFIAPSAAGSTIAKAQGGVAGYVRAGGAYYVYADIGDSGSPASGTASVRADVAALTAGATSVPLSPGSFSADGVAYDYRSAQLTAGSVLGAGSRPYSLALDDAAGNARSQSFAATVDNGPFAGSALATANASGGNSGKAERGDAVTFSYNQTPEPGSILPGWSGVASASITVAIAQSPGGDTLSVAGAGLGSVALKGDFVDKTVTFAGSSMALSGSSIVITLGTPSSPSSLQDENSAGAPVWSPSTSAYDRAANPCSTSAVAAPGQRQF